MFNDELRLNKPVLSYWMVAASYTVFGVSVTSERIVIALSALGILAATIWLGRSVRSRAAGVLAALLLATAPRFVFFARRSLIDIALTLFMAIALAAFAHAIQRPSERRSYFLLMWTAIGLGMLTKGPVALVLPAAAIGLWLLLERRLGDLRHMHLAAGALVLLAIVVPWYAALHDRHGWEPIIAFFVGENLGRFASSMTTERSPLFFLGVLFGDILMPWAPLIIVPMWSAWRRAAAGEPAAASLRRLLWIWIAVIVAAFSLSASKEDLYILPVAPAAAVLVADALSASRFGLTHRGVRVLLGIVSGMVAALGVAVWWWLGSGYYRIASAPVVAGLLVATGAGALLLILARRPQAGFAALAGGFVLFNLLFVLRVLPGVEALKPVRPLAAAIRARASVGAPVASYRLSQPSLVYYLNQAVPELRDEAEAVLFLTAQPEAWLVTSDDEWDRLRPRAPGACVAFRRPRFDARLSDVLRGVPPPDVILVTSRCAPASPPR
jgi:4-amino-4-deoxy-L-arabinose transferase-like glycosyltransferase